VTRRGLRCLQVLSVAAVLAGGNAASLEAREISAGGGVLTLTYDDTIWSASRNPLGDPSLSCTAAACGGDSASCDTVILLNEGDGLTQGDFLGSFRRNLGENALNSARALTDPDSTAKIISPPSAAEFGANAGIALSMQVAQNNGQFRIDQFWLLANSDLAGITCVVPEADHERARQAFEAIFGAASIHTE